MPLATASKKGSTRSAWASLIIFLPSVHRPFIERCSTCRMSEAHADRKRIAARDALAARTRKLTGVTLTVSALLSGVFAGIAAASAPGHKLLVGGAAPKGRQITASARTGTAIPPLPAPPGSGNLSAAPPAAAAPSATQAPPVVVSGGS